MSVQGRNEAEHEELGIDVNLFLQVICILANNIISQFIGRQPHPIYSFSLLTSYCGFRKTSVCSEAELGLDIPTGNQERCGCIITNKFLKEFSLPVTSITAEIHQVLLPQIFCLRCSHAFITSFLHELSGLETDKCPLPFPRISPYRSG